MSKETKTAEQINTPHLDHQIHYILINYLNDKTDLFSATDDLQKLIRQQLIEEIEKNSHIHKDKWTAESPMVEIREIHESWWQQFKVEILGKKGG